MCLFTEEKQLDKLLLTLISNNELEQLLIKRNGFVINQPLSELRGLMRDYVMVCLLNLESELWSIYPVRCHLDIFHRYLNNKGEENLRKID